MAHLFRPGLRSVVALVAALGLSGCGSYFTEAELAARQGTPLTAGAEPVTIDTSGVPAPAASGAAAPVLAAPAPAGPAGKSVAAKGSAPAAALPRTVAVAPAAPAAAAPAAATAVHAGPRAPIVFCSFGNSSGVLGAVSGPAPAGNAAWASWVNAHGGLAGHPVRMINADDGGAAANAQAIAQKCVEQEHAVAIFNEYTFGELDGALPYLKAKGVPVLGSIGAALSSDHSAMVFNPMNGADVGQAWGFIDTITSQTERKNLAVLYCQEAATCTQQVNSFSKLLPFKGLHIVYKAQVSLVQPDYTAQLLQAKNAGADVVVLLLDSASVGRVARNAAQQDYHPVLAGTYNLGIQATLDQGSILEGLILASRTPAYSTSPLLADYREAMARYQPGKPMGDVGAGAFVVGGLLQKYADQYLAKDTVTSTDILTLLRGVKDEKLGGLLPGITFPVGDDRTHTNQCIAPVAVSGGRFVQRGGFVCAPGWRSGA